MSENKEVQQSMGNEAQVTPAVQQVDRKKKPNKRMIIAIVLLVLYSVVLVFATVKIDRAVLAKRMEKAFSSAFDLEDSTGDDNRKDDTGKNKVADSIGAKAVKVNLGETIANDTLEIVIDTASTSQEIKPADTSRVYSYIGDKDGETYFFLTGNLKNIAGVDYDVDELKLDFCFDEKYNYTGRVIIDVGENDFYNTAVKPLQTVKYYMYASIPDEMIESYSTCTVQFAVKDSAYEITVTK